MDKKQPDSQSLAATITKAASKQTYYTIRFFVDGERIADAYRAYGYFRWMDDVLDASDGTQPEKMAFVERQKSLLEACYHQATPDELCAEEWMLVDLVRNDTEANSGLQAYLRNMMAVMIFDARRRDQIITQAELTEYSRLLATAVTEALFYFIGHGDPAPDEETRYLAVTAAHITHMLRDTLEDCEAGYFNIPREYLQAHGISPLDLASRAYREWVCGRIQLASRYFKAGRESLAQAKSLRRRLAGYAYVARFEWVLRTIEADNYCLRPEYPERRGVWAGLWMGWSTLASLFLSPMKTAASDHPASRSVRMDQL